MPKYLVIANYTSDHRRTPGQLSSTTEEADLGDRRAARGAPIAV
jgi:hypothetical protein